jgi:hypothetical protein
VEIPVVPAPLAPSPHFYHNFRLGVYRSVFRTVQLFPSDQRDPHFIGEASRSVCGVDAYSGWYHEVHTQDGLLPAQVSNPQVQEVDKITREGNLDPRTSHRLIRLVAYTDTVLHDTSANLAAYLTSKCGVQNKLPRSMTRSVLQGLPLLRKVRYCLRLYSCYAVDPLARSHRYDEPRRPVRIHTRRPRHP